MYVFLQLLRFEVDDCHSFTDCGSCVGSGDSLCGWCVLERKCSSHEVCKYNTLRQRWIQESEECLVEEFHLPTNLMALDYLQPVSGQGGRGTELQLAGTEV